MITRSRFCAAGLLIAVCAAPALGQAAVKYDGLIAKRANLRLEYLQTRQQHEAKNGGVRYHVHYGGSAVQGGAFAVGAFTRRSKRADLRLQNAR